MGDLFNVVQVNPSDNIEIKKHLENIRQAQHDNSDLLEAVSATIDEFNKYFLKYGEPSFSANMLTRNDVPTSSKYNENLETLADDLEKLYATLLSLSESTISAFNYATIVSHEVNNQAAIAASKVLDLNIINNFVKGTTIVGGDDFIDDSKIDKTIGAETTQAEVLDGANAVTLLAVDAEVVSNENTAIEITPLMPVDAGDRVNTDPTPENLKRFYEGNYYAPLGEQRAAGGNLKLKYIVDPSEIPPEVAITKKRDGKILKEIHGGAHAAVVDNVGFYAVVPPTIDELKLIRTKMVDGNPSTFWECEYVYSTASLIDPLNIRVDKLDEGEPNSKGLESRPDEEENGRG
jgi:hypothetical protein